MLLKPGDLLIINNTRVVPARLYGRKESGGRAEILVLEHPESLDAATSESRWCLLKSSKRPKKGNRIIFEKGLIGTVEELDDGGLARISFSGPIPMTIYLKMMALCPCRHYIKREDNTLAPLDRERYQTIFSKKRGAIAALQHGFILQKRLCPPLKSGE
jgi:S-adenosylmethionine:tRNA ribosyltransferase-isomerase